MARDWEPDEFFNGLLRLCKPETLNAHDAAAASRLARHFDPGLSLGRGQRCFEHRLHRNPIVEVRRKRLLAGKRFHEVFHALTISAFLVQFAAIAMIVLP